MLENVYSKVNKSSALFIPHAGGDAGLSMVKHLIGHTRIKLILQDDSSGVVDFFKRAGYKAQTSLPTNGKSGGLILPSIDHNVSTMDRLYGKTSESQYDKIASHVVLRDRCSEFKHLTIPKYKISNGSLVIRISNSSGSKGTQIVKEPTITTKFIEGVEYVVDYNIEADMFMIRSTYGLECGRDTRVCIHSSDIGELGTKIIEAVKEGANALNCTFGNMQLIHHYESNTINFIENAPRLSGSSWLNLLTGNNILFGIKKKISSCVYAHTSFGLL